MMKLCRTCRYGSEYELDKPCVVYRDDCPLYEKEGDGMTNKEAKSCIKTIEMLRRLAYNIHGVMDVIDADNCEKIIKALKQECVEPTQKYVGNALDMRCDDAISRQAVDTLVDELARAISDERCFTPRGRATSTIMQDILDLPPVNPQPKTGHCKDCKYFEYDSVAKVDGIPLIVAHEICSRWGDGCKTREDGYCFLFEPQESEE